MPLFLLEKHRLHWLRNEYNTNKIQVYIHAPCLNECVQNKLFLSNRVVIHNFM